MQQAETRALWRAVALLILVSAGRFWWSSAGPRQTPDDESVLQELLVSSRDATEEGARRAEPLAEGERLDPNRATEVELDRLAGVGPATARAIVAAREAGAVFRRPDDLLTVRGIGAATLQRIRPGLDFGSAPAGAGTRGSPRSGAPPRAASSGATSAASRRPAPPLSGRVDLNTAGAEELLALPGIGPALAQRILDARQEQMFTSLDDLVRVRGIGVATVERLRPHASVGGTSR